MFSHLWVMYTNICHRDSNNRLQEIIQIQERFTVRKAGRMKAQQLRHITKEEAVGGNWKFHLGHFPNT